MYSVDFFKSELGFIAELLWVVFDFTEFRLETWLLDYIESLPELDPFFEEIFEFNIFCLLCFFFRTQRFLL